MSQLQGHCFAFTGRWVSFNNILFDCHTIKQLSFCAEFIFLFLEEVIQFKMNDNLTKACQNAYNATLAQHHPWIIQKAAIMAMYALPNKDGLLVRVSHLIKKLINIIWITLSKYFLFGRLNYPMNRKNSIQNFYPKQWWPWKKFSSGPRNFMKTMTFLDFLKTVNHILRKLCMMHFQFKVACFPIVKWS